MQLRVPGAMLLGASLGGVIAVCTVGLEMWVTGQGLLTLQGGSVAVWVVEALPAVLALAGWGLADRSSSSQPSTEQPDDAWVAALRGQLGRLQEQARQRDHYVDELVGVLLDPLRDIIVRADVARSRVHEGPLRRELGEMERAGRDAVRMLSDLRDVARLEQGNVPVVIEDTPLKQILDPLRKVVWPGGRPLQLERFDSAERVTADPVYLPAVLENLVREAFGRGGRVVLDVEIEEAWTSVRIADSGPILSDEAWTRALRPYTGDPSPVWGTSGLGVATAAQLTALMGGALSREEGPTGTLLILRFPRATPGELVPDGVLLGRSVMLLDASVHGGPLAASLQGAGAQVEHLRDTASARLALQLRSPDLAVCDADTVEVWPLVRDLVAERVGVVVISSLDADVEPALAAGAASFMCRPLDMPKLIAQLDRAHSQRREL